MIPPPRVVPYPRSVTVPTKIYCSWCRLEGHKRNTCPTRPRPVVK